MPEKLCAIFFRKNAFLSSKPAFFATILLIKPVFEFLGTGRVNETAGDCLKMSCRITYSIYKKNQKAGTKRFFLI
jgi:hypothetical protein